MSDDLGGLGWDYATSNVNSNNIGYSYKATTQMALSWTSPFFVDTIDRFTLVSAQPKLDIEVIG